MKKPHPPRKKNPQVKIAKGLTISRDTKESLSKKAGSSNIGKYKKVSKGEFAGPSGGAAPGTFPINTKKRAKAALAYSHNAPNPSGIKKKVYAKYPSLKPNKASSRSK